MQQLEILVLTPKMNEEDMYVLKFEKGREFIEKTPYYHDRRCRMIRCKTITEETLQMLLWEAKCGYFGGWYRINRGRKMIRDKELST